LARKQKSRAFQNGSRIEKKTLRTKKRRANGDRELFRMARDQKSRAFQGGSRIENAAHKEKARDGRSRAVQNGSRLGIEKMQK